MTSESDAELDELLGRTRCARCGQILDGDIECPFCSLFPDKHHVQRVSKWVFLTACFLTSPLSLPFLFVTRRLTPVEKAIAGSGMALWAAIYWLI